MRYLHFWLSIFVGRLLRFIILGLLIIAYGPEILHFLADSFAHHRGAFFAVVAVLVVGIILLVRWVNAHNKRSAAKASAQSANPAGNAA
jgi:membrane protein DedA with SNARE-associated domain